MVVLFSKSTVCHRCNMAEKNTGDADLTDRVKSLGIFGFDILGRQSELKGYPMYLGTEVGEYEDEAHITFAILM